MGVTARATETGGCAGSRHDLAGARSSTRGASGLHSRLPSSARVRTLVRIHVSSRGRVPLARPSNAQARNHCGLMIPWQSTRPLTIREPTNAIAPLNTRKDHVALRRQARSERLCGATSGAGCGRLVVKAAFECLSTSFTARGRGRPPQSVWPRRARGAGRAPDLSWARSSHRPQRWVTPGSCLRRCRCCQTSPGIAWAAPAWPRGWRSTRSHGTRRSPRSRRHCARRSTPPSRRCR